MPTFDTGHLFLTFLTPVKSGPTRDPTGAEVSHEQLLRMTLGMLPTALQSPATVEIGHDSPFVRNRQTHLCRFLVLDDVIFNGRNRRNALVMSLRGEDPVTPNPVDRLDCAYLLFAADIDAVMEEGDPLPETLGAKGQGRVRDAYLERLWRVMEPELRWIYDSCVGFDDVRTPEDFARYMARCQIETTMPFNDYWITPPRLSNLPVKTLAGLAALPVLVTLLGLLGLLLAMPQPPLLGWVTVWSSGWTFLIGALVTAAVLYALHQFVLGRGGRPMPPAKYGDLPSVLKSLYLQQNFASFVVDHQGRDAEALHAGFADFLKTHKPSDRMTPTQPPGVISTAADPAGST